MSERTFPGEHAQRHWLIDELHARQAPELPGPARATFLAILVDPADRQRELDHIGRLCAGVGASPPRPGMVQFTANVGGVTMQWEPHGEFSGLTFIAPGHGAEPFREPVSALLPQGWLSAYPGSTLVAAHAKLITEPGFVPDPATLDRHFAGNVVVGSNVGDGAGMAFTDFRLHEDGYSRFLLVNRHFTPRQAGRMLQRLFDIESYRMLALLALPVARRTAPRLDGLGDTLAELTAQIAQGEQGDEVLLPELTSLAARIERELAQTQFRFDACIAYREIVRARVAELRESRLPDHQPIDEFLSRRFGPAVARVDSVSTRLRSLSERVARASALLSTRVDIATESQNQKLLASMNRRAHQQLRLQQTVEGLSVAAITYYATGLVGYAAKGLHSLGLRVPPDEILLFALPVILVFVLLALRRAHRALESHGDESAGTGGPGLPGD